MSAHLHARHRGARCTRTGPLPLLPSGPGGVGGIASRGSRYLTVDCNKAPHAEMRAAFRAELQCRAMATAAVRAPNQSQLAIERFFQTSLYLLVLSGFMLLASTRRLHPP